MTLPYPLLSLLLGSRRYEHAPLLWQSYLRTGIFLYSVLVMIMQVCFGFVTCINRTIAGKIGGFLIWQF